MKLNIEINGIQETIANLDKIEDSIIQKIKNEVKKTAFRMEVDAKKQCPVDTGRLMNSISSNWTGSGIQFGKVSSPAQVTEGVKQPKSQTNSFEGVVGTNVEYAPWVEFPTSKTPGRRFLKKAFLWNKNKFKDALKDILKKAGK